MSTDNLAESLKTAFNKKLTDEICSLDFIEAVMYAEDIYGIEISDEELDAKFGAEWKAITLQEMVDYLKSKDPKAP